ncbi:MAG: hypothetical protein HRU15_07850, partial [Planctomycetes bacterium]|nr:hypothetical protein [Planctomycetota bacterium]
MTMRLIISSILMLVCTSLFSATIEEADALYDQAMLAMKAMNDDSVKSVEAAVCLYDAKLIYEEHEQWQRVREVKSYIFYCKKKMNVNELDSYVVQLDRAKATAVRAAFSQIEKDINEAMTLEDADLGFKEAEVYAAENPNEHLKIHMRYLDISERAIDNNPTVAIQASRKSSDALQQWVAQSKAKVPDSPFKIVRRGMNLMGQDAGFPIPSKKTQKSITKKLQKQFPARMKKPQDNMICKDLMKIAQDSLDQPDYAYVCALLAAQMAISKDVNDVSLMMQCVEFIAQHFGAEDIDALRRRLAKESRSSSGKAVLKLFDDQADLKANREVGLSYCFVGGNWQEGLPLLTRSEDVDFKQAVAMENAKPMKGIEQRQLADVWYDIAKQKNNKTYELDILAHACKWYARAKSKLSGISKEQVESRLLSLA